MARSRLVEAHTQPKARRARCHNDWGSTAGPLKAMCLHGLKIGYWQVVLVRPDSFAQGQGRTSRLDSRHLAFTGILSLCAALSWLNRGSESRLSVGGVCSQGYKLGAYTTSHSY